MWKAILNLFIRKETIHDAPEEHRITLPGLDISFNHSTKTVWIVDQTGGIDNFAIKELEKWFTARGYFMHYVLVQFHDEVKK